jgi:hypothetical protein
LILTKNGIQLRSGRIGKFLEVKEEIFKDGKKLEPQEVEKRYELGGETYMVKRTVSFKGKKIGEAEVAINFKSGGPKIEFKKVRGSLVWI